MRREDFLSKSFDLWHKTLKAKSVLSLSNSNSNLNNRWHWSCAKISGPGTSHMYNCTAFGTILNATSQPYDQTCVHTAAMLLAMLFKYQLLIDVPSLTQTCAKCDFVYVIVRKNRKSHKVADVL